MGSNSIEAPSLPISVHVSGLKSSNGGKMAAGNFTTNNVTNVYQGERTKEKKQQDLMNALLLTIPSSDRGNIVTNKGNIAEGTCRWIKEVKQFESWLNGPAHLLWICGGPGKGKTFFSIYLVQNLSCVAKEQKVSDASSTPLVLEYFCDYGDKRRNTALAVLRGLLYQLLDTDNSLYEHILPQFEYWQKNLFSDLHREDLWEIFMKMVGKVSRQIYFVLDGLDECDSKSIRFLTQKLERMYSASHHEVRRNVKTIIVSRKLATNIQNALRVDLDHEHSQETEKDLNAFILSQREHFEWLPPPQLTLLQNTLSERANGTFLWVALAIEMLKEDREAVLEILGSKVSANTLLPKGLDAMYNRMLLDVLGGKREVKSGIKREDAAEVIRWVSMTFRPLTVAELCSATGIATLDMSVHIHNCRHILLLTDHENMDHRKLQLVHLSLKDYLLRISSPMFPASIGLSSRPCLLRIVGSMRRQTYLLYCADHILFATVLLQARHLLLRHLAPAFFAVTICSIILWTYRESPFISSFLGAFEMSLKLCIFSIHEKKAHKDLFLKCLELMKGHLKRDICQFQLPGALITNKPKIEVEKHLPRAVQYACRHWVDHLQKSETPLYDNDLVHAFLRRHLLHWLEAHSLMQTTSEGILAITSLQSILRVEQSPGFHAFIHDAKRFALYNQSIIQQAPLQLYCSALIFAPETSIVRRQFKDQIPRWICRLPKVQRNWSSFEQTLEGHADSVRSVAFSPDGSKVASGSDDRTVRIWDVATGQVDRVDRTLEGHSDPVLSVAFSPDGRKVVSGSSDRTVRIWDVATEQVDRTLKGHLGPVWSVAFSPDGSKVASESDDQTTRIWDVATASRPDTRRPFRLGQQRSLLFQKQQIPSIILCRWIRALGDSE